MNLHDLKEYILKNGGATLEVETLETIKNNKGFMVSYEDYETTTKNIDEVIKIIKEYQKDLVNNNIDLKNNYIGIWYNIEDNTYYIDISILYHDKRQAERKGKENKQKAIYDLKNNKSIYLNYNIEFYTIYKVLKNKDNDIIDYKVIKQVDNKKELINFLGIEKSAKNLYKYFNNVIDNMIIKKDIININEL